MLERLKNNLKDYFSNGPKAAFVMVLVLICCTLTIINSKKTIEVVIDGNSTKLTTLRSNLGSILVRNNIAVGAKDKIMPGINSNVKNGDKIFIKRAVKVAVEVDGKVLQIKSAEDNVESMLRAEKITLDDDDKVCPSESDVLINGMEIAITRVDSKILKQNENIDFATIVKNDDSMEKGVSKTIQDGTEGTKELSFKVIYENGMEVSRKLISEIITQNPVNKIVAVGTLGVINQNRGAKLYYTRSLQVKATAYSADFASTGKNPGDYGFGITATGTRARRTVDGYSSIAVDPRVIPLGTKVYIPGYGCAIAEDVGGAIKGNTIDLYFDSEAQAIAWGVKWVPVYILK